MDPALSFLSGPGRLTMSWSAEYFFRGQPGLPGTSDLPGLGLPDVRGWTTAEHFPRLAVQVLTVAARRWWSPDVPPAVMDFGEALLRGAQEVAEREGQWHYEPSDRHDWAEVTVTYHPVGEPPPEPRQPLPH
ncbi:hypothetical protein [Kitasatospora purpeofusca]|uniref:hypothetical protein n=1 Tax=Kitasatospora purpeofusca TaxID=67352 RepID=UPI0036D28E46